MPENKPAKVIVVEDGGVGVAIIVLMTLILILMIGCGGYVGYRSHQESCDLHNNGAANIKYDKNNKKQRLSSSSSTIEFWSDPASHTHLREYHREEPGQMLSRLLPKHMSR